MGNNSLLNKHLKVASVHLRPYIIFYCDGKEMQGAADECPDKSNISYGGSWWEILDFVQRERNITYSIVKPSIPSFGNCYEVNNCSGMIGMVNQKEVDLALGKLHISLNSYVIQ